MSHIHAHTGQLAASLRQKRGGKEDIPWGQRRIHPWKRYLVSVSVMVRRHFGYREMHRGAEEKKSARVV